MRRYSWMLLALVGLSMMSPLACDAQQATPVQPDDYAQRERDAVGLEEFSGGFIITALVIIVLVLLIIALWP